MVSGKNIQNLDLSKSIISKRRNPVLADVFARLCYMERQGSGIKKSIENYELEVNYSEDLKLEFFSDFSQFSVILKNLNYGKSLEEAINRLKVNKNTKAKALRLFQEFGYEGIFGRKDVALLTGDSETAAGGLIKKMKEADLIVDVKGYGKGKYRFLGNQI